jgi:hypothetical protein
MNHRKNDKIENHNFKVSSEINLQKALYIKYMPVNDTAADNIRNTNAIVKGLVTPSATKNLYIRTTIAGCIAGRI